jgi:hypothetical protein
MSAGSTDMRPTTGLRHFLAARWHGDVPLDRIFWRDMLIVGTAINVAATLAAIAMLGAKLPLAASLAVHFAPTPYNLFLAFAVWRAAECRGGVIAFTYQMAAIAWLVAVLVI